MHTKMVSIIGLRGFPMVKVGDNIAKMIAETAKQNAVSIEDGDIVVVAQKIVSKAEGRIVKLSEVIPSEQAEKMAKVASEGPRKDPRFVELVLRETKKILKFSPETLIVENKEGLVCINAGIDKSNVAGKDVYSLLPKDPDRSAKNIRSKIMKLTGKKVAVVISDTYSRPFRKGHVDLSIGIAGIKSFKNYRGQGDIFNHILQTKNIALVDEIASAAELVMGQGKEAVPVVIIKNLNRAEPCEVSSIRDLNISRQKDLYKDSV